MEHCNVSVYLRQLISLCRLTLAHLLASFELVVLALNHVL